MTFERPSSSLAAVTIAPAFRAFRMALLVVDRLACAR